MNDCASGVVAVMGKGTREAVKGQVWPSYRPVGSLLWPTEQSCWHGLKNPPRDAAGIINSTQSEIGGVWVHDSHVVYLNERSGTEAPLQGAG